MSDAYSNPYFCGNHLDDNFSKMANWVNNRPMDSVQVIPADGAIALTEGTVILTKGSAAAITGIAPTAGSHANGGDDGNRLWIVSATNFAHVVTFPANSVMGPSGAKHIVTMVPGGAALGFMVVAYNGAWYLQYISNGTLT